MSIPTSLSNYGKDALGLITGPIQEKVNQKIDALVVDIRAKIAFDKGIEPAKVTDLEISEYLLAMPLAGTNTAISESASDSTKIIAGSIVIGFSLVALAVFFSRKQQNV